MPAIGKSGRVSFGSGCVELAWVGDTSVQSDAGSQEFVSHLPSK